MTDKPKSTSSSIFNLILVWTILLTLLKLFENPLINSAFIFLYMPITILGHIGLLVLLIFSIIYWVRQRNKVHRPFLPFAFNILTIVFIFYFPFNELTLTIDFKWKQSDREKIVKMIQNKQIKYDLSKSSSVEIPKEYSNLSADLPKVIVEVIDGDTCVFFYTFRGITDNSAGVVYIPNQKTISKFKVGQSGQSTIFYDPIEITKVADNWYFVSNT